MSVGVGETKCGRKSFYAMISSLFLPSGGGWRESAISGSTDDGEAHGPEDRACSANPSKDPHSQETLPHFKLA